MRLEKKNYFIQMAVLASMRSTCLRRSVGCVLVDEHSHVVATGYNGAPKGTWHCVTCVRTKTGEDLYECRAVHAEQNALLQCSDVNEFFDCYVTHFPCKVCLRLLYNTGCNKIYYLYDYPSSDECRIPNEKIVLPEGQKCLKI